MHELMFQAGVKGMSERTSTYIIIVMLHLSVRLYRVSLYIYIYIQGMFLLHLLKHQLMLASIIVLLSSTLDYVACMMLDPQL